jgi:coenzyme F420-reducing hydrogenase beta subunit
MCIGCGACVHADSALRLVFNPTRQMFEPSGPGGPEAAAVCPSVRVDYGGLQKRLFGDAPLGPLGAIEQVLLAQSTDRMRNVAASSGGVIKELLREYLAGDEVDGAIALQHTRGLDFEPQLIREREEVDRLPGSIYHAVPFGAALRLLSENSGRFVLVATPCQLEGIYSYIFRCRPDLTERIHATIGLLCGWQYTHHAIRAVCTYRHIDFDAIQDIAFRGGGPVGRLRIRVPQREYSVHRRIDFSYQVAFDRSFNIPRCHLCINHTNFLADLVVGDAWLPSTVHTKTGMSLVICRSKAAVQVMARLTAQKRIVSTAVSPAEIVESQTRRVAYGDFSYAYADYLRQQGAFVPELIGPNRTAARLTPRAAVKKFHRQTAAKVQLQRARRYRQLYLRKLSVEVGPLLWRYVRWFFVRVMKVKSLLGLRREVPREKLAEFA